MNDSSLPQSVGEPPPTPWYQGLAAKFIVLVATLTALALGAMAWFSYQSYRTVYFEHLQSKVEQMAKFIASISPDRIFSNDFSTLYTYVKESNSNRDIVYAVVFDNDNQPMTAYLDRNDPVVGAAIAATQSEDVEVIARYIDQTPDIITLTAPIVFNEKPIGRVVIGATSTYADQELRQILIWNGIASTVIIALLSGSIYLWFRLRILRPTRDLTSGAKRVARGELRVAVARSSGDELGQLAASFNEMMRDLDETQIQRTQALDELRALNRTLEMRVEERTRAIEAANRRLQQIALYDALTGLPNRTLLRDRLDQTLASAERAGTQFVLMLLDLDRFKHVNDTHGHHIGDQLLANVSERLSSSLRESDTVARLGGDEFAILLPNTDVKNALLLAAKIIQAFEPVFRVERFDLSVGTSIGIALYPAHGADAETLLKRSDSAMYRAKQSKSGFCMCDEADPGIIA